MSILYLCIVKPDGNFSAEFPSGQKAIKDCIKNKIRPSMAPQDYKDKYVEGSIRYNWENTKRGYTFFCVTTEDFNLYPTFECISEVKKEFIRKGGDSAPGLKDMLSDKKKKWMKPDKEYNKLLYLEQETYKVKEKMIENVDKIMSNLEKVDDIKDKSSSLADKSRTFRGKATDLASGMQL
eukprot:gene7251-11569_t